MYHLHRPLRLLAATAALGLVASRVEAQPLTVRPIQNLSFGFLLPGVATTIDAAQLARSGQIEVTAAIGTQFEIRYTLPTVMNGAGTTLPLTFGAGSAGAAPSSNPANLIRFNPATAARFQLVTTTRATFFLGGRAAPRVGQPVGSYTAPVVVTITNLGI
jgi:hypothetical protein